MHTITVVVLTLLYQSVGFSVAHFVCWMVFLKGALYICGLHVKMAREQERVELFLVASRPDPLEPWSERIAECGKERSRNKNMKMREYR